ncbi:MAG: MFS transporter, partial [Proteobacteria bacterium]|nr:MFS transporter [Pseudomonadota bacterium]
MARSQYRTAPEVSQEMPKGIPYIIGNEAAERFSYYGMRTVLIIFMTQYLRDASGELAVLSEADATVYFHWFGTAVYLTPIAGALLADVFLGKYRTIVSLSIVYCLGHLALAMNDTLIGLALGLGLIALGSGGIKPCVSAHVGDQFGDANAKLLPKVYSYFYFAINLGAFISVLLTPLLLEHYGPHAAFGLPGALMILATWVFWFGRQRFVHIPPGGREFLKEAFSGEGIAAMLRLSVVYLFIAVFWALFDQS